MIDYAIHCVSARAFSSSFGSLARRCVLVFVDGPSTASQASPWRCSRMTQAVSRATARRTERWETESLMERLNRMLAGWGRYYCLGSPRRIEPWMLTCDIGCVDGYGTSTSAGGRATKRFPNEFLYGTLGLVRLEQTTRDLPWAKA